jgi:hypothetical protein
MDLLVTVSWAMANDYVILVMPPMLWPPHDHLWAWGSLHCSVFVLFSFVSISLFLRFCWPSWMMSCELKLCPYFHLMHCNWSFNSLVQVMLSLRVQLFPRLDIVDWILLRVQFMRRTVNLALPLWAQHPWLLLLQPGELSLDNLDFICCKLYYVLRRFCGLEYEASWGCDTVARWIFSFQNLWWIFHSLTRLKKNHHLGSLFSIAIDNDRCYHLDIFSIWMECIHLLQLGSGFSLEILYSLWWYDAKRMNLSITKASCYLELTSLRTSFDTLPPPDRGSYCLWFSKWGYMWMYSPIQVEYSCSSRCLESSLTSKNLHLTQAPAICMNTSISFLD